MYPWEKCTRGKSVTVGKVYPWEIKKAEEEQKKILNMHFCIFCQNSDFGVKNWFEDIFMISNILNCIS